MLDILSTSPDQVAAELSNATSRTFQFDGVACASIESVLQAFKMVDPRLQREMCNKSAKKAHLHQTALDRQWQKVQKLHWLGRVYPRTSDEYQELLTRLYNAVFDQDPKFRRLLQAADGFPLAYSAGLNDQTKTVLTTVEFLYQLYRLQARLRRVP